MDMNVGLKLPPELETATRNMVQKALSDAITAVRQTNSYPDYMNQRQAAKYLGTSPATIIKWEKANIGFPTIYIEGSKHYHKAALDSWMKSRQKN